MADMASNSESNLGRNRDDDHYENMEGNEAPSGDDQEHDPNGHPKRKRYNRHTHKQIQEMEAFFRENPHPDDRQRKELGLHLGLEPLQIKFWFQNKRTQVKTHQERHENAVLKAEIDKLRAELDKYKEALSNATCPNCGGPAPLGEMSFEEQHLRMENARLREKVHRLSGMEANPVGNAVTSSYSNLSSQNYMPSHDLGVGNYGAQSSMVGEMYGGSGSEHLRSLPVAGDSEKNRIVELAVAAMEELTKLALAGNPLWIPCSHGSEILNEDEYFRTFPRGIGPRPLGFRSEASRDSMVITINHINLVEILMDVNQWSKVFCGIVSRARTHEVLSTGVAGNYNGALQLMSAELQVPSPLVLTRRYHFLRYCKQQTDGSWIVVDVSFDNLRPSAISKCRRRPSGCVIQELPNGYSKVTWVEHVEVEDTTVHNLYKLAVNSGLAFGAKRFVASLDRQCQRLANMAADIQPGNRCVITGPEGRKSIMKLGERMIDSFYKSVGASPPHAWTQLAATCDDVKVMTRKSKNDPGRPPGLLLNAATSFWLPVPPKRVFDFLRDQNSRSQWDILCNGDAVEEIAQITNGRVSGNCISLLRINSANPSRSNMLILQESCTDCSGSYVIYAPIDVDAMNTVLGGNDPNYVGLLPSGFAILADGPKLNGGSPILDVGSGGCLLTISFQILVDSLPTTKLSAGSVTTINSLLKCTIRKIKDAVMSDNTQHQI